MEIIPAIYVLDGKVVALYKGSIDQKETYGQAPVNFAQKFQREGAQRLYVEDINARMHMKIAQPEEMKKIIDSVNIPIMLAGVFSTTKDINEGFELGAKQVVLRSPSLEFAEAALSAFGPERIVIQLFAKRTELIEEREKLRPDDYTDVVDYAEKLVPLGAKEIIYKDRRIEGTLIHPNYDEIDRLYLTVGQELKIYSSGGISEPKHINLLKKIGASGAIIGKALYENRITLTSALEAAEESV